MADFDGIEISDEALESVVGGLQMAPSPEMLMPLLKEFKNGGMSLEACQEFYSNMNLPEDVPGGLLGRITSTWKTL